MKVIPDIPVIFENKFPNNYPNEVHGWGSFSKEVLENNKGKLLTLDIDFGDYCSLNCPHCFRKNNRVDRGKARIMEYDDIIDVIKQGKKLGLRTVKFLGAGEPFENERLLEFLRELKKMGVLPAIFTKGHVIGDDNLVKKWYSNYGIKTGEKLIEELKKVDASILLGFNSFDTEVQDRMVGGVSGYTAKRNRALELLVKSGFNKHNPTRLCLGVNPVTKENYDEVLEIYKWARVRNLYIIVCPTMVSGRCAKTEVWKKITPSRQKMVDLYTKIYLFNLEKGLQTLEQIEEEGVSAYAGAHPCNQVSCGMYVTLRGTVLRCPGDDVTVFGSIWKHSLKDIWLKSENCKRSGTFNCFCPPKEGKTMPTGFYDDVLSEIKKQFQ
jgi:MoaA/NifB/PqqE/SkfB family radical SAM enzyme